MKDIPELLRAYKLLEKLLDQGLNLEPGGHRLKPYSSTLLKDVSCRLL